MDKFTIKIAAVLFMTSLAFHLNAINSELKSDDIPEGKIAPGVDLKPMLENWSASFVDKIDADYKAVVRFKVADSSDTLDVVFADKKYQIQQASDDSPNFIFESSIEHYNRIYAGKMTALTSMGQATSEDPIPLVPTLNTAVTNNLVNDFLFFSQRFFNTSPFDKVTLKLENARIVHGGHAIPIFYQKTDNLGVRSAWYQINKGEQVNEVGDTNPFPQYFIITQGEGVAKLGDETIAVKSNEAYFIAPGTDHVFWNENDEPLVMIFIAWGQGA